MSHRDDRGSVAIWALAFTGLLVAVAATVALVAAGFAARQRATAAADLAALAGASALARGEDACAAATTVARADGARLVGCRSAGAVVDVVAATSLPSALAHLGAGRATAAARAGPAADGAWSTDPATPSTVTNG